MKATVQNAYGPPDIVELTNVDKPTIGDDEVLMVLLHKGHFPLQCTVC